MNHRISWSTSGGAAGKPVVTGEKKPRPVVSEKPGLLDPSGIDRVLVRLPTRQDIQDPLGNHGRHVVQALGILRLITLILFFSSLALGMISSFPAFSLLLLTRASSSRSVLLSPLPRGIEFRPVPSLVASPFR